MPNLHSDDIVVFICLDCKKLLNHEENCGTMSHQQRKWLQHKIKKTNLTNALNFLLKGEKI